MPETIHERNRETRHTLRFATCLNVYLCHVWLWIIAQRRRHFYVEQERNKKLIEKMSMPTKHQTHTNTNTFNRPEVYIIMTPISPRITFTMFFAYDLNGMKLHNNFKLTLDARCSTFDGRTLTFCSACKREFTRWSPPAPSSVVRTLVTSCACKH